MKNVYYNGIVQTKNNGNEGVSVICGGETLEKVVQDLITSATYYWALGYQVKIKDVRPYCITCHGAGKLRKGTRVIKYVKCPDCKGKGDYPVILSEIPVIPSQNITVTIN